MTAIFHAVLEFASGPIETAYAVIRARQVPLWTRSVRLGGREGDQNREGLLVILHGFRCLTQVWTERLTQHVTYSLIGNCALPLKRRVAVTVRRKVVEILLRFSDQQLTRFR